MSAPLAPNITDASLYAEGIPHERFAEIRDADGLLWHEYHDGGFWVVGRHADVKTVSKDCLLYTSPSPRDATLSRMPSSA